MSFSPKPSGSSEEAQEAAASAGEEDTQRLNADVPESLHQWVRVQAAQEGRSMKEVLVDALNEYRHNHSNE
jgi:predicted HicB family RNase H-like nuclease